MLLFGLFIWLCWILFITALLLPIQERIENEAINRKLKIAERKRAETFYWWPM